MFLPFVGLNFERSSSSPGICEASAAAVGAGLGCFPGNTDLGIARAARAAVAPALLEEPPMFLRRLPVFCVRMEEQHQQRAESQRPSQGVHFFVLLSIEGVASAETPRVLFTSGRDSQQLCIW